MSFLKASVDKCYSYSAVIDLSRQILPSKVDPYTVRIKIFLMIIDLYHRYSNESERANEGIYDDFKLKNPLVSKFFIKYFSPLRDKPY